MRLRISRESWLLMVLLIAALGLSLELAMQYWLQSGICPSTDCALAGQSVRFGEQALVWAGAIFFWVLFGLCFYASRFPGQLAWNLALVLLLGALAFDGGLLGYQFLELNLVCWLCIAVALGLIIILVLISVVRRTVLVLCLGLAVWIGAGSANAVLLFPTQPPALEQTWFMQHKANNAEQELKLYLFFSLNCGHCSEVLANLARQDPQDANWYLCSLDQGGQNLRRLTYALEQQDKEPFSVILEAKQMANSKEIQALQVPDRLEERVQKAREFFRARGYRGVPLLVALQGDSRKVVLTGVMSIAQYLWEQGLVEEWKRL